jgi:ATP-dependent Clp protease adaptor protein ClpS
MPNSRTKPIERTKSGLSPKEPSLYHVILLNDHYTTMEFVIDILERVFHKGALDAQAIMLSIHEAGSGIAGTYPRGIAETKVSAVAQLATAEGFPLRSVLGPVE